MSFSFNTYEDFARRLKNSTNEVDLRNSVSRGYYNFYHKVKKLFGYLNNQYVRHEDLIAKLKNDERINKGAKLSNAMQVMKEEREYADYKVSPPIEFNKQFIEIFWRKYDNIIKLLEEEDID